MTRTYVFEHGVPADGFLAGERRWVFLRSWLAGAQGPAIRQAWPENG